MFWLHLWVFGYLAATAVHQLVTNQPQMQRKVSGLICFCFNYYFFLVSLSLTQWCFFPPRTNWFLQNIFTVSAANVLIFFFDLIIWAFL